MFSKIWSVIATVGIIGACLITKAEPTTWVLSLTGIAFVLGVANGWKYAQMLGAILVGMYGYLSYSAGFYGNMLVNLAVILPMQLYGSYQWLTISNNSTVVRQELTAPQLKGVALVILNLMILGIILCVVSGSSMPIHDGISSALVIVATFLMVNRYKEQWYVWIPYNVIECAMWFMAASLAPEILAVFVMRVIFLANSLIGFYVWSRK